MEDLPSDVHRYLHQFLDQSTKYVLPLTCKRLLSSLGLTKVTLEEAVRQAASDDQLRLLLYFLAEKKTSQKEFVERTVIVPALAKGAHNVLYWYKSSGFQTSIEDVGAAMCSISLSLFNQYFRAFVDAHDYFFHQVLKWDRLDLLSFYFYAKPVSIANLEIVSQDSPECFQYYQRQGYFSPSHLEHRTFTVLSCSQRIWPYVRNWEFNKAMFHNVCFNERIEDVPFFKRLLQKYAATAYHSVLCGRNKTMFTLFLQDYPIREEHCEAVFSALRNTPDADLNASLNSRIQEVFSLFEGKFAPRQAFYACNNYLHKATLELVASRLTTLQPLLDSIIKTRHYTLFEQLLQEGPNKDKVLAAILKDYHRRLLEIYLYYYHIPAKKHLACYNCIGEELVSVLQSRSMFVSTSIEKRKREIETRESNKRQRFG